MLGFTDAISVLTPVKSAEIYSHAPGVSLSSFCPLLSLKKHLQGSTLEIFWVSSFLRNLASPTIIKRLTKAVFLCTTDLEIVWSIEWLIIWCCTLHYSWQGALLLTCVVGLHGWSGQRGSWGNYPELCTFRIGLHCIYLYLPLPHLRFFGGHSLPMSAFWGSFKSYRITLIASH